MSDEYALLYEVSKNKITILLPQTWTTLQGTTMPIVNRRVDVDEWELLPVLLMAKKIFEVSE